MMVILLFQDKTDASYSKKPSQATTGKEIAIKI
jgi:hypothetical protein